MIFNHYGHKAAECFGALDASVCQFKKNIRRHCKDAVVEDFSQHAGQV